MGLGLGFRVWCGFRAGGSGFFWGGGGRGHDFQTDPAAK